MLFSGHAIFELNDSLHTLRTGNSRSQTRKVRLNRASDQDGVGTLRQRIAKVMLKLSRFVSTECWSCKIITLDVQFDAKFARQTPGSDQRRWIRDNFESSGHV